MVERFLGDKIALHAGDCRDVLATLPENSLDACVTDPPYHLTSIVQRFGGENAAPAQFGSDGRYARASAGFMGRKWDGGDVAFRPETWAAVYRVLKPGAHLITMGGTRTYHRLACAIEDAGFEIRDTVSWLYGSGFPKSLDVSKGIDRMDAEPVRLARRFRFTEWLRGTGMTASQIDALTNTNMGNHYTTHPTQPAIATRELFKMLRPHFGCDVPAWVEQMVDERTVESENFKRREILKQDIRFRNSDSWEANGRGMLGIGEQDFSLTAPATDAARKWQGWGTALKPATEICVLAQKPFENGHYIDTIGSTLLRLWGRLWLMLSAKAAAEFSALSPSACGIDVLGSAQWNADDVSNTRAALSAQMDMSRFESALISSLSTVSSWAATWAESWTPENTSTIETELKTTTDLRTLNYLLSRITPDSIIRGHKWGRWSSADASNAARAFNAVALKLQGILELSVLAPAFAKAVATSLDVGARPDLELIVLARKPLSERTVAANVLRWGTGAINVDGCRVASVEDTARKPAPLHPGAIGYLRDDTPMFGGNGSPFGRWPANLVHDGSAEVVAAFPSPVGGFTKSKRGPNESLTSYGFNVGTMETVGYGDEGSAARFFYTAKADADDRLGSKHPTVKPLDLMQWLVRLVTPRGGVVLDPFAGTGTTGEAAWREGMRAVLIEAEPEYQADIRRRMALALAGPDERQRESIKARNLPRDDGPLFAGRETWAQMWAKPFDFSQEPRE